MPRIVLNYALGSNRLLIRPGDLVEVVSRYSPYSRECPVGVVIQVKRITEVAGTPILHFTDDPNEWFQARADYCRKI